MTATLNNNNNNNDEADAAAGMVIAATTAANPKPKQPSLTKRQRRKIVNDKHKWANFPKIQDATQRANAYLRSAGLLLASKKEETKETATSYKTTTHHSKQKQKQQQEEEEEENRRNVTFGRRLGSPDVRVRHKTVLQLQEYLKARCAMKPPHDDENDNDNTPEPFGISELDLLKLTKCLWYTLYMCDRTVVQDELSKVMADLIWCFAGDEEVDEYAAAVYLQTCYPEDCRCDEEHKGNMEEEVEDEDNEENYMEVVEEDGDDDESSEEEEEEEESSMDTTQKQIALLEDNEDMADDDEDEEDDDDDVDDLETPHCQGAHLASLYLRVWFRTIVREWGMLDKYRIDKFYVLLRYLVSQMYKYMARRHWNLGIIQLFNDALYEEVLTQTPNGIRYHIIDVVLEELAQVDNGKETPIQLTEATFLDVLEPFFAMAQTGAGGDIIVQARVVEKVLLGFLEKYSAISDDAVQYKQNSTDHNHNNEEKGVDTTAPMFFENVHVGTVAEFIFQLASDPSCEENGRFRKSLYETHKSYQRRLQTYREHDVDIGSLLNHGNDDEDELEDDESLDVSEQEEEEVTLSHFKEETSLKANDNNKDRNTLDGAKKKEKRQKDKVGEESKDCRDQQGSAKKQKSEKRTKDHEQSSTSDGSNVGENSDRQSSKTKLHQKEEQTERKSTTVKNAQGPREVKTAERKTSNQKVGSLIDPHTKSCKNSNRMPSKVVKEEEITITVADQKAAKQAMQQEQIQQQDEQAAEQNRSKPDKSKKRRQHEDNKQHDTGKKRVKFGNNIKARSWQASMQALHTMETPPIPRASPDKGILLNKQQQQQQQRNPVQHGKKKQGGRKKASDYFF
jgi:hypothetical protein